MKRIVLTISASTLLSAAALASNGKNTGPGDPQKPADQKTTFGLSDGYFSIFNIFFPESPKADTTSIKLPAPQNKSNAIPKK
jgi:hypothetical protein